MLAYGEIAGELLSFEQVRYAHQKYSSHRRIPEAEVHDLLTKNNVI
jgi:hypothetical protein